MKANARVSELEPPLPGETFWRALLKAAPIDGKANEELMRLIARHFNCQRASVSIRSGSSGRLKLVRIELPDAEA